MNVFMQYNNIRNYSTFPFRRQLDNVEYMLGVVVANDETRSCEMIYCGDM